MVYYGKTTNPEYEVTGVNKRGLRNLSRNLSWIGFGLFLLMLAVFPVGDVVAAPPGNSSFPSPTLEWSLEADIVVPDSEIAGRGLPAAQADAVGALTAKLKANGVETETSVVRTGGKGVIHSLKASGTGDVETFRNLIYRIAKPQFNILGGVTQLEVESPVREARDMVLVLEANPSTGSSWKVTADSGMTARTPPTYEKHTLGYGVPQRQVIRLTPGPTGIGPIRLVYKRSWEATAATRRLKLKLSSMPAKLDLSNPDAPAVPLTLPKGVVHDKVFPSMAKEALPEHLDWRDSGIVTPIRDQESCGSCWAFGTVGIMESALWKKGVANKDLSEQYLVSCNKEGWNCDEGGFTAHMYHYDTPGKNQSAAGAVLESVKPYTGTDGTCKVNYDKPYVLTDWRFITGSEDTVPTVDQIKSAIYTYGPITAGVCAGSGWDDYSGGIFTQDETSECDGSTNHQIILVGWDNPGQYWILRNSWGTGWGIDGYMHIKWDVSRVGEGTSWVTTAKKPRGLPWLLLLGN
jgi:C1A family cysteine protease